MENNKLKFSNSKFYEINRILNGKPWKYIYKELMPKTLYKYIQGKIDFLQQEAVAESWDRIIEAYFKGKIDEVEVFPKKSLTGRKIIWQYWGTGWEYGKLPDIVKLCYKLTDKYKGNYEIIRLDNENFKEYIEFPEFVMEKIKSRSMGYTHFSDLLRLALLDAYGGVWLDASILLTASLSDYTASGIVEKKGYFMFQRSESTKNKEFSASFPYICTSMAFYSVFCLFRKLLNLKTLIYYFPFFSSNLFITSPYTLSTVIPGIPL